jgi:demethylphylloquinone reductase
MLSPNTHICILGGGFGGLYTALYLQRFSGLRNCRVTLVDPKKHFLFTPLMYELVTGELQPWEIAPSFHNLLQGTNVKHRRDTVETVDLRAQRVKLQSGKSLTYDYLVLAVGKDTDLGAIPGAAEHAYPFRTLADAQHLREQLRFLEASERSQIRIAIVGGGPSGVELAGKLADRLQQRGQIRLIARGDDILKSFSRASRITAYRTLGAKGVQVDLHTSIVEIGADWIAVKTQGEVRQAAVDLVLWTTGNQPIEWIRSLECDRNSQDQLIAHPTLQLQGYPEVFVLGDLADVRNARGQQVPATAQVAYQQADHAAKNLWAVVQNRRPKPFRYLHLGEMITLGTDSAAVFSFGLSLRGRLACVVRRLVYLQRLPTLRHRLRVIKHQLTRWLSRRSSKSSLQKPANSSVPSLGQTSSAHRGAASVRSEPIDLEKSAWRSPDQKRINS